MTNLVLKMEVMPGAVVRETVAEAIAFSARNDCWVVFQFNGVTLHIHPGSSLEHQLEQWSKNMEGTA